jgi:hypothetical protein
VTGERILLRDSFFCRNRFYGGQLGLRGERRFGNFSIEGTGKLAVGITKQRTYIEGATLDEIPGFPPVVQTGGLLAGRTNIGRYYHNEFTVVPELQLRLGYQVTNNVRLSAGYNYLYVTNVARPGDQIDLAVNSDRLPRFGPGVALEPLDVGPLRPAFQFNKTSFWATGVTGAVELKY